jgi:uncharacterized protein YndB with AHSA1/START domain
MPRAEQIVVSRTFRAPRDRVWALYTDHAGWTKWAGLGRVTLEREGTSERDGVGCIRAFHTGGPPTREEVVDFEPPRRMAYTLLSGAPIRDHRGEVLFEELGTVTVVTWQCRFGAPVPFAGPLLAAGIRFVFERTLRRLDRHLARGV